MHPAILTGRGRLSAEREAEVYDAVLDEVIANGYERFSYDNVAAGARCSKATLYRLWDSKADLVVNALLCDPQVLPHVPVDGGSLRDDLHAFADSYVECGPRRSSMLMLAVARASLDDPALAAVVREQLLGVDESREDDLISRAVARGEIDPASPALPHLLLALVGPLALHEIVTGEPLTAPAFKAYLDAIVLPALEA